MRLIRSFIYQNIGDENAVHAGEGNAFGQWCSWNWVQGSAAFCTMTSLWIRKHESWVWIPRRRKHSKRLIILYKFSQVPPEADTSCCQLCYQQAGLVCFSFGGYGDCLLRCDVSALVKQGLCLYVSCMQTLSFPVVIWFSWLHQSC